MDKRQLIDEQFQLIIGRWRIAGKLGITSGYLRQLRYKLKHGIPISLDTKMSLLTRYGFRFEECRWTDKDMVEAIRFSLKISAAAKEMGPEYVLEKFKLFRGL